LRTEPTLCDETRQSGRDESLADRLRRHTRPFHRRAERSGVTRDILEGRASREAYALFLSGLLPVYRQLESGLECHRHKAFIGSLAEPAIYRSDAIASDLTILYGTLHADDFSALPAARRYAARVAAAADTDPARLIGHAYTRYLGDLNGGRILRKLLIGSLQLEPAALSFYDYPDIELETFGLHYRSRIDAVAREIHDIDRVVDEAVIAFQLNIELSIAVQQHFAR